MLEEERDVEEQVVQAHDDGVNDDQLADDQEGQSAPEDGLTPDLGKDQVTREVEALDESGVPWKNRAMELERKYKDAQQFFSGANIEKVIEQTISKTQAKPKEEEIDIPTRIAQLRQFAVEQPEHTNWAETEIERLRDKQLEVKFQTIRQKEREEMERTQRKQQSEQNVLSAPQYDSAFVRDALGNKVLNPSSPLAQLAQAYLNDTRISSQPDAVEIAFKLGYADFVMNTQSQQTQKVTDIKRQNEKLKQATLVEGGGTALPRQNVSSYQKALEEARSNPSSRTAQHNLVKEALRARGVIR